LRSLPHLANEPHLMPGRSLRIEKRVCDRSQTAGSLVKFRFERRRQVCGVPNLGGKRRMFRAAIQLQRGTPPRELQMGETHIISHRAQNTRGPLEVFRYGSLTANASR